jgi:twitching motility protein PilT
VALRSKTQTLFYDRGVRDRGNQIDTAIGLLSPRHLVLGTLHTKGTVDAVKRLLNFYSPEEERDIVRLQIVEGLRAVIGRALVPAVKEGQCRSRNHAQHGHYPRLPAKGGIDEIYQR